MTDSEASQNRRCESRAGSGKISVVVPCYNEGDGIEVFYKRLKTVLVQLEDYQHEMVFVDDGSCDESLAVLERIAESDRDVQVYSLSRNFGHQIALTAGLDVAAGDAVILMDSDLQHPPDLIPAMVERWELGAEVVSTIRRDTGGVSFWKRSASRLFYRLANVLSETPVVPGAADFCLLSRRAHLALKSLPERHRFLRGLVAWIGFRRDFVEFEAPERLFGRSRYTLRRMLQLAVTAITSHSVVPLRVASRLGLLICLCGVVYLAWVIVVSLFWPDAVKPGWASLMSVMLILGGVQLVSIGLLGEYLGRVYEESKHRPLYFFKRTPRDAGKHRELSNGGDSDPSTL